MHVSAALSLVIQGGTVDPEQLCHILVKVAEDDVKLLVGMFVEDAGRICTEHVRTHTHTHLLCRV